MINDFQELSPKASQLGLCFYDDQSLPSRKREHIFNASWGGSHKTGQLICDDCNVSFSTKVDQAFLPYTNAIMNACQFKGERHKCIPPIQLEGNHYIDSDAKLKLKEVLVEKGVQKDGQILDKISANSRSELKRWARGSGAELWLEKPLTEEKKNSLLNQIRHADYHPYEPTPQDTFTSITVDPRSQYRSAAHTILKCLGLFFPDCVKDEQMTKIRQFARYDEGDWEMFAVKVQYFFEESVPIVSGLEKHFNLVEIYWCSHLKMVIGVLNILNNIKRAVVLAKDYSGPDKILYVFEDTNGSKKPPRAFLAEKSSDISVKSFASPYDIYNTFQNEFLYLAAITYPTYGFATQLKKTIEKLNKKFLKVDEITVNEYQKAFLEILLNIGKTVHKSIDENKVYSKMAEYGFEGLDKSFIGKSTSDKEFKDSVMKIFENLVIELTKGALYKSTE